MKKTFLMGYVALFISCSCYPTVRGRVFDIETSQPIEGAIVLVEWTKTHGFGEHWTETCKVVEKMSDKREIWV